MNKKTVLLLLTLVILIGAPTSLAKPEYLADLIKVYGVGTCDTCHVNGTSDGPRTPYGTLFEEQPDHAADAGAALLALREAPPTATSTVTPPPPEETATPAVTTVPATPASPGFGIAASLAGLFTLVLLTRKRN